VIAEHGGQGAHTVVWKMDALSDATNLTIKET